MAGARRRWQEIGLARGLNSGGHARACLLSDRVCAAGPERGPGARAGAASGQFNTTVQLANAVGAAALGTLFFEIVTRHVADGPSEAFADGFLAILLLAIALMGVVIGAARIVPADIQDGLQPGAH